MQTNSTGSSNSSANNNQLERKKDGLSSNVSSSLRGKGTATAAAKIGSSALNDSTSSAAASSRFNINNNTAEMSNNKRMLIDNKASYRSTNPINNNTIEFIDSDVDEDEDNENENNDANKWRAPPEWRDDTRMNALFAPFRARDLNPLHYDNKLKFWKDQLEAYCRANDYAGPFDVHEAARWFTRNRVTPKCLELVVDEMAARDKRLVTLDDALRPVHGAGGLIQTVFSRFVWQPLSWSAGYFFRSTITSAPTSPQAHSIPSTGVSPSRHSEASFASSPAIHHVSSSSPSSFINVSSATTESPKKYVLIDLLNAKSYALLKRMQDQVVHTNVDCVVDYEHVRQQMCNEMSMSNDSDQFELMMRYLEAQRRVYIDDKSMPGRRLVKLTLNSNRHVVPSISEIELSFIKLKDEERKLEADVSRLGAEIENLTTTIKVYLKQGNKPLALKLLKKRKLVEKSAENKEGILANVQTLIMNIEQADTNQLTYDLFTEGVAALREVNKGMSADKIDETMDDLQEIIQANVEIEDTLAKSSAAIANKYNIDESELISELDDLIATSSGDGGDGGGVSSSLLDADSFDMDEMLRNLPTIPNTTAAAIATKGRIGGSKNNENTNNPMTTTSN